MGLVARLRAFRWRIFGLWMAGIAVASLLGLWGAVAYTSRPSFCSECHLMEPYFASWQAGAHKDVGCLACHAEPGIAGTIEAKVGGLKQLLSYSIGSYRGKLPQGYVSDANCTHCHPEARLREKPVLYGEIEFSHAKHLDPMASGLDLKCTACHTMVDETEHIGVPRETCLVCHLREGGTPFPGTAVAAGAAGGADGMRAGDCLTCHDRALRQDPGAAATHSVVRERGIDCRRCHGTMGARPAGDGDVTADRCRRCHFERKTVEDRDDVPRLHGLHTADAKVECTDCHAAPPHESDRGHASRPLDCAACHEGLHAAQRRVFLGAAEENPAEGALPPFHRGLQCQSCHLDPAPVGGDPLHGFARVTTPDSCRTCHRGAAQGDFGALVGKWKEGGRAALAAATAHLEQAKQVLAWAPRDATLERAERDLREAQDRLTLLGSASPVHNIHLARRAVQASGRAARAAVEGLGLGDRLPPLVDPTAGVPAECARCHLAVGEGLPVGDRGRRFSHQRHLGLEGVTCRSCHADDPDHGTLWASATDCSECHHRPEYRDRCARCHPLQSDLYDGRWGDVAGERKNLMATEVHCVECHFPDDARRDLVRPRRDDCMKCHGQDVGVLLEDWKATVGRAADRLAAALRAVEAREADLSVDQRTAVRDARAVLEDVRRDGSGGIHNPWAVERALSLRAEAMDRILGR